MDDAYDIFSTFFGDQDPFIFALKPALYTGAGSANMANTVTTVRTTRVGGGPKITRIERRTRGPDGQVNTTVTEEITDVSTGAKITVNP